MAYRASMPIRTEVRSSSDSGRHDYVLEWDDLVYLHLNRLALFAQPAQDDYAAPCPGYEPGPEDTTPPVRFRTRSAPTSAQISTPEPAMHTPLGASDLPTTTDAHMGPIEPHPGATRSTPLGAFNSASASDTPMGPAGPPFEAKRDTPLGASDMPSTANDFMPSKPNEPHDLVHIRSLLVYMHNHLACQDAMGRTLMQAEESRRLELQAVSAQLQQIRTSLTFAQQAYADLRHELDSIAADFLAYRIRTEAELSSLREALKPMPSQINTLKRIAILPYNAHLQALRTFQVPANRWEEANPHALLRRELLHLEDRLLRLEAAQPPVWF